MSAFRFEKDSDNIVTITMDMPGQSANTMNEDYVGFMEETISRLEGEKETISGVVITSAKDTFFAGGDLNMLLEVDESRAAEFFEGVQTMHSQLRRLETLGVPVVAAINGAALGGGFEITLACHHRVMLDTPKAVVGLPEVQLGLMPGAGGTVRLTRMIGLIEAFPLVTQGTQMKPARALKARLVDELAADAQELMAKSKAWIKANPDGCQPWDKPGYQIPGGNSNSEDLAPMLAVAPAMLRSQTKRLMPAPEAIMAAAVEGALVDIDTALRIEARYFTSLVTSTVAKNMINSFFFQLNSLNAGSSRPEGIAKRKVEKLGILGAGMMGAGIAYVAAKSGIDVVLKDVSIENAEKGKFYSDNLLSKQLSRGRTTQEKKDQLLGRIHATADAADLAGCDLVIEAVFENPELKGKVTREAEAVLGDKAIMASNTSSLQITGLAKASSRPNNFVGIHFFSPVDKMPLVEIIAGEQTSDEALALAFDFVLQIKKTPIVVNDAPGFYTTRVFSTFLGEGAALLQDGVHPQVIDNVARFCGMPVGPLAQQDEVSQQLAWDILTANKLRVESEGGVWPESAHANLLDMMVNKLNRKGRAYEGGFYDYAEDGSKTLAPEIIEMFYKVDVDIPEQDMRDRMLFCQTLEAVRAMEDGVLRTVIDGNIGAIFGIGYPPYTGGPFQFINSYGVAAFVERARELANAYGERFEPPALLVEHAEGEKLFQ